MVFFVCDGCNESLKKNQVDKHATRCRTCDSVTCVDCQVTFSGDDYRTHVTCVSEAEKYEKGLFKGKKQKLNPQESWNHLIAEAAGQVTLNPDKVPQSIRHLIIKLGELSNVPRNRAKFTNFVKNSLRLHSAPLIGEIWSFLESFKAQVDREVNQISPNSAEYGNLGANESMPRRKNESVTNIDESENAAEIVDDFNIADDKIVSEKLATETEPTALKQKKRKARVEKSESAAEENNIHNTGSASVERDEYAAIGLATDHLSKKKRKKNKSKKVMEVSEPDEASLSGEMD